MLTAIKTHNENNTGKAVANTIRKNPMTRTYLNQMGIQAKLTIGKPNDKYEQEADRVADKVITMPDSGTVQRSCSTCEDNKVQERPLIITPLVQRQVEPTSTKAMADKEKEETIETKAIQKQEDKSTSDEASVDEEEIPVQTKSDTSVAKISIERGISQTKGGGSPLPASTRFFMENRFGTDFSHVRIHNDNNAIHLNKQLNSLAFTKGNDIYFNRGRFNPESDSGKHLLAHELVHVIQQGRKKNNSQIESDKIQRAAPAVAGIGAIAAKCIIGAIIGALFDAGIQSALQSWKNRTWKFWKAKLNYCSIILSAILGCIAAPISAFILEPWIVARLGALGGIAGTLIGKILIFIAKKLGMIIPKSIVGKLVKLGCISPQQAVVINSK